ncbi:MAG: hypothetical protein R3C40_08750 [Parvularculaceae bacterium]
MTAFEQGDLLVSATEIDADTVDFRKGIKGAGRLLHLSADLELKESLWTEQNGLVVGVGVHPQTKTLYTADPHGKNIVAFDSSGARLGPVEGLPVRPYGAVAFDEAGRLLLGVLTAREAPPEDGFGDASLYRFDPTSGEIEAFRPELDGGRLGWHCISNMSYLAERGVLYYVAEAGRRLSRYDLRNRHQMDDFLIYDEADERRTYGVGALTDGRLVVSTGVGAQLLAPDGSVLLDYTVSSEKGWTRVTLPPMEKGYFFLNNFLDGVMHKRDIETGEIIAAYDIQNKFSLCGMAEVA